MLNQEIKFIVIGYWRLHNAMYWSDNDIMQGYLDL